MPTITGIPPRILPCRQITGYSAILLPFCANGSVDWGAFCAHVARTAAAGLIPAINFARRTRHQNGQYHRREPLL